MNNQSQTLMGCTTWIAIIMVIVAAFRSNTVAQFFIMAAIIVFGLLAAFGSLTTYAKSGFGNTLLAFWYAYAAIMLLWSGGYFLRTGNYEESIRIIWRRATPAPTSVVESEPPGVPIQSTIPQATVPPAIAQNPNEGGSLEGEALSTTQRVREIWLRISANTASSQPVSEQFESWRLITGIILGLQYVMGFYVAKRTRQRHVTRNFIVYGVIFALLMFTKLGEWIYSFFTVMSGWGDWGNVIIIISVAFIGLAGFIIAMMGFNNTIGYILIATICTYIITSFMYHNIQMLQFCVVPSIVMMSIVLYIAIYQARYRRYLKFG